MLRSVLACLALALAACGERPEAPTSKPNVDLAQPTGANTYVNQQFGIGITAPEGWLVADNTAMEKIAAAGQAVVTDGGGAAAQKRMAEANARTVALFSFSKSDPAAATGPVSGLVGAAEDVSIVPGINRGRDYFDQIKASMRLTKMDFREVGSGSSRAIDGTQFDRMDIVVTAQGRSASQRYFAARHGKYMIVFIQSYANEGDLPALDGALDSIKLNW